MSVMTSEPVTATGRMTVLESRRGDYGMSFGEAAAVVGVSRRTIWRRVKAGEIHSVKVSPKRTVILASEVARLMSDGR